MKSTESASVQEEWMKNGKGILYDILSYAGLFLICLLIMGANPIARQTVAPMDLLIAHGGFESFRDNIKNFTIVNPNRSDVIDAKLATWQGVKKALWTKDDPTLILTRMYGTPGVQLLITECLTPSFLVYALIHDDAIGFYFASLIKLLIAAVGMYLLLRIFVNRFSALFGVVVFLLGGQYMGWFFVSIHSTIIWFPWLFFVTVKYLVSADYMWLVGISIASAMMILGSFLSVIAFGFYAFSLLVLVWNIMDYKGLGLLIKRMILPFVFVGIAFCITFLPIYTFIGPSEFQHIVAARSAHGNTCLSFKHLALFVLGSHHLNMHPEFTCYMGILPIIFSCIACLFVFAKDRQVAGFKIMCVYSIVAIVLSIAIAFGFLPVALVRKIPVFSINPWQRLLSVTQFAIAILSALGFQSMLLWLKRHSRLKLNNKVFSVIILIIIAIQWADQNFLINRKYNAIVPNGWFLPRTESIKYVQERIFPLQSVIGDNSYMLSGTLEAYNLKEAFNLGLKTDMEKTMLAPLIKNDPYVTYSDALIIGSNINFSHPRFDATADLLALRFILMSSTVKTNGVSTKWKAKKLEPGIIVLENTTPTRGVMFVESNFKLVTTVAKEAISDGIDVNLKKSTWIQVTNRRLRGGWIVFSIRNIPGWNAYIDGKKASLETYAGVFPCVRVERQGVIDLKYQPETISFGWKVSVIGIVMLVFSIVTFVLLKKKKEKG
ncbi:MAG: hypothetical protein HZC28_12585 [Spirochaetes bacterium]|nr:hypothetical protein [Spirochaetota bacterium]